MKSFIFFIIIMSTSFLQISAQEINRDESALERISSCGRDTDVSFWNFEDYNCNQSNSCGPYISPECCSGLSTGATNACDIQRTHGTPYIDDSFVVTDPINGDHDLFFSATTLDNNGEGASLCYSFRPNTCYKISLDVFAGTMADFGQGNFDLRDGTLIISRVNGSDFPANQDPCNFQRPSINEDIMTGTPINLSTIARSPLSSNEYYHLEFEYGTGNETNQNTIWFYSLINLQEDGGTLGSFVHIDNFEIKPIEDCPNVLIYSDETETTQIPIGKRQASIYIDMYTVSNNELVQNNVNGNTTLSANNYINVDPNTHFEAEGDSYALLKIDGCAQGGTTCNNSNVSISYIDRFRSTPEQGSKNEDYLFNALSGDFIKKETSENLTSIAHDQIEVFPNPSSDFVSFKNLTNEETDIQIFSSFGSLFAAFKVNGHTTEVFDASQLPVGIYLAKVSAKENNWKSTIKFIISR